MCETTEALKETEPTFSIPSEVCVCVSGRKRERHITWFHSIPLWTAAMDHLRRVCARVRARAATCERVCVCVSAPQQWITTHFYLLLLFFFKYDHCRAPLYLCEYVRSLCARAFVQLEHDARPPALMTFCIHDEPALALYSDSPGRGEAPRTWREWQWLTSAALHASSTSTLLSHLNGLSVNETTATSPCTDPGVAMVTVSVIVSVVLYWL